MKFYPILRSSGKLSRPSGRSAFSLIELLVTLAVIGVLAAILVPVMNKARASAQLAENTSQLRMLGIASLSYAAANNGIVPVPVQVELDKSRMTQGPVLYATQARNSLSMMSSMWDPRPNPGSVWGASDYLAGPESFYGPFTPDIVRTTNGFSLHNGSPSAFLISYVYYSLPSEDYSTPKRNPVYPHLFNDQLGTDALPSSPLFSDISTQAWADLVGGYNSDKVACVHLDGSVSVHDREYIWSLGSNDKIKALAGVLVKN